MLVDDLRCEIKYVNDQHTKEREISEERHARHVATLREEWAMATERLIAAHRAHIEAIQNLHLTIEFESMRERTDLKKAHAEELNRVIEENQKLKDDVDRFRLLLTPALQNVELPKERTAPPSPSAETVTGTPWQRTLKRELANQTENPKLRRAMEAAAKAAQGESHGSSSEGRVDASLGGESKPA